MNNPFRDIDWNPDRAGRRKFARTLTIGFPVLATVFAIIGWLRSGTFPEWTLALAVIGFTIGLLLWIVPQIARPFYLVWYFFACCIGIVVSNLLLIAFYYLVLTPIGLVMRLCGRDPMKRRFHRDAKTYWTDAEKVVDPRRYFRQF